MKNVSPLKEKSILIVDDEMELRRAIAFDFKRRGCIVYEAANGNEAFEIVMKNPIHIVVSDVRMPNGTGLELLKRIRQQHPTIPIVLLATGFADLSEHEALKLGALGLIEKPIDRKRMMQLLESSCEL